MLRRIFVSGDVTVGSKAFAAGFLLAMGFKYLWRVQLLRSWMQQHLVETTDTTSTSAVTNQGHSHTIAASTLTCLTNTFSIVTRMRAIGMSANLTRDARGMDYFKTVFLR